MSDDEKSQKSLKQEEEKEETGNIQKQEEDQEQKSNKQLSIKDNNEENENDKVDSTQKIEDDKQEQQEQQAHQQQQKVDKEKSRSRSKSKSKEQKKNQSKSRSRSKHSQTNNKSINQQNDQIKQHKEKSIKLAQSPKSVKSQKQRNIITNSPKNNRQNNNNEEETQQLLQEKSSIVVHQQTKTHKPIVKSSFSNQESTTKIQSLESMLDDKLRQIKQLKDELKKEKERSKLLEIELSAVKDEHSKCLNQANKSPKPLPPTKTFNSQQKIISKKSQQVDDFWSIQPPEIMKRKNIPEQVFSSHDNSIISSQKGGLIKRPSLVRSKPSQSDYSSKQSSIRVKKMSQPVYDDNDDEDNFWSANLPQSITKRKQDLLHDSNLWINQLNHIQNKNTKLPVIASGPLRIKK